MSENNEAKKSYLDSTFGEFELSKPASSNYIKPYRLKFKQNERQRIWDGIASHASVSCVIYNSDKKCIILVRQFRPVVFVSKLIESQQTHQIEFDKNLEWTTVEPREAFTYELCAGICDKSKSNEETMKEEILEECGYSVSVEDIHKISACRSGVGLLGALHTIYYTEVNEQMKTHNGGGNEHEGEFIELYELEVEKIRQFIADDSNQKPQGLLYALMWFLYEREHYFKEKSKQQSQSN